MNVGHLVYRGLVHHRWMNLLVLLGVATTTAVITGALLVGQSVRGSLTDLTLDRLGAIDLLLFNDRFFDRSLVSQVRGLPPAGDVGVADAEGLCILNGVTVEGRESGRARGVVLVGRDAEWSQLGLPRALAGDEILLNAALAEELGAQVGHEIIIRLPQVSDVPAESPLGRKDGQVRSRTGLRVVGILPNQGWGQFQLRATQQTPRNAFVATGVLQQALNQRDKINAIAVSSTSQDRTTDVPLADRLQRHLRPSVADAGLRVEMARGEFRSAGETKTAWRYVQVTTDRMIFDDASRAAAFAALAKTGEQPQPIFAYLANTIARGGQTIPYSTIAAVDAHPSLGPYVGDDGTRGRIEPGQIFLNAWAADDLGANLGDRIEVRFFAPETTHGTALEEVATFQLTGVLPLRQPIRPFRGGTAAEFDQPPTWANDPQLTPTVEGVTDQASIDDWDPPFPFDSGRVREEDDQYWSDFRTTPKAFISLDAGLALWTSRFGALTAVRVPASERISAAAVEQLLAGEIHDRPEDFGFEFRPVKLDGLTAAQGTTPFEWLFLGFSMFLVFSALMLTAILFQLSTMLRQSELGVLQAVGWSAAAAGRVILGELLLVACAGATVGLVGGIAYASLMLAGLRTWWLAAVVTPFIRLHIAPSSLLVGLLLGILTSVAVVWATTRGFRSATPLALLRRTRNSGSASDRPAKRSWPAVSALIVVVACSVAGVFLSGEAQAGAFFASGAGLLAMVLLLVRLRLRGATPVTGRMTLARVARTAIKRNPSRSLSTVALVAAATFLIMAIGAFRLQPNEQGTGGFTLIAECDRPVFADLNDPRQRRGVFNEDAATLDGTAVIPLRVTSGDDASCRNLYQSAHPRLLGITSEMAEYFAGAPTSFAWAKAKDQATNPWNLLLEDAVADEPVPVILDKNTAIFSLHLAGRVGEEFTLDYARPIRFRIVALLSNTVLQGSLIVSESQLLLHFPEEEGYRMFLVSSPPGAEEAVANVLERRFADEGMDARDAAVELESLMAVQNTYLSTFQSLGALGLLLGTIGLAIVQMRNVVERRSELATMRAVGFSVGRLQQMLAMENALLLSLGLGTGLVATLAAVVPHLFFGDATLPTATVAGMLVLVLVVGLVAGIVAGRSVARTSILESLRRDT